MVPHCGFDLHFLVLEKTLERPLDSNEIQPVYSKGDWSWVFLLLLLFLNFTILYWYCHTSTCIRHGCTCVPPPTSLSIPSLWVIPVHQPQASVSCIEPGLAIHFLYDIIHILMPFSQIIPPSPFPSPSPTESKRLFYTAGVQPRLIQGIRR